MTEHEKLKWICDKIGIEAYFKNGLLYTVEDRTHSFGSTQDTIFTQEFMTNFLTYCLKKGKRNIGEIKIEIINNLDNPVEYLYNLIK